MSVVINVSIAGGGGSGGGGGGTWGSITGTLSSQTDLQNALNAKIGLSSVLTGYTVGTNTPVLSTDTLLAAFGKLQAEVTAAMGNGAPQATYGLFSGGALVGPSASVTECARIRIPANKFGKRAIGMLLAAGQKNSGTTDIVAFSAYAGASGFSTFSSGVRLTVASSSTAAASSGTFYGCNVVGNLVDQTTVKAFMNNASALPFVQSAIPASTLLNTITVNTAAAWDIVLTGQGGGATDQFLIDNAVFVVYDPDAVSAGGTSQPTAWQTATVGTSPAPVVLDYSVSNSWYIPNTITNLQPIQVTNMPDGRSDLIIALKGGGGSGLWTAFSGATPTTQGFTMDQPGALAPVADASALNGVPVFIRSDNAGFNLRATVGIPYVLTPP